jgi:hypothetical protein
MVPKGMFTTLANNRADSDMVSPDIVACLRLVSYSTMQDNALFTVALVQGKCAPSGLKKQPGALQNVLPFSRACDARYGKNKARVVPVGPGVR